MSILKKMLVRLPVSKSYLRMAWEASVRGQNEIAEHLFKMAYEQETLPEKRAEAAWNVYVYYKNKERYHEAYLWCERTARLGFVKAMRILGKAYYYGLGIVPSYRTAAKWLRQGADAGDAVCMRLLGECYYHGRGMLSNVGKAYEYFRSAYELKESGSYYWIGLGYHDGNGGYPKDVSKAIEVWTEGIPSSKCLCELGKCHLLGDGVPKNEAEAYKYFRKVSDQGRDYADKYLSPDKTSLRK